jgi:hypothetical protein
MINPRATTKKKSKISIANKSVIEIKWKIKKTSRDSRKEEKKNTWNK